MCRTCASREFVLFWIHCELDSTDRRCLLAELSQKQVIFADLQGNHTQSADMFMFGPAPIRRTIKYLEAGRFIARGK